MNHPTWQQQNRPDVSPVEPDDSFALLRDYIDCAEDSGYNSPDKEMSDEAREAVARLEWLFRNLGRAPATVETQEASNFACEIVTGLGGP